MTIKYLIEKEFKQIFRDKFLPKILFVLPLVQLLILPLAANFEMKNINLTVVDEDNSEYSRRLTEKIISSNYFNLTAKFNNYQEALTSIESGSSDIIIQFPEGVEKEITNHNIPKILIAANSVNGTKGSIGSLYLSSIISHTESNVNIQYLNNPYLNYKYFMVPGIIAFLITLIGGFVSALNIVSEKEKGTIEQINVSPIPKRVFIMSKIIPFWIIGFIELTLSLIVAWAVYGLTPQGSYLTIYLFASIYLLFCTGFGLAISSISNSQQQAMFTAFFFLIIMVLMSGLFTPVSSMPDWAQKITIFNPLKYFVDLLRIVFLKGGGIADLSTHFTAIVIFSILINATAILLYKKNN